MTQIHTAPTNLSRPTNTPANTNVGRKAGALLDGRRSTPQNYRDAQTMYDRLTGPQMVLGYHSFAEQAATVNGIVQRIANEFEVPVTDIMSDVRTRDVAQARQDAMLEIRDTLGWPVKRIGRLFGRDHTTVLHSLRVAEARK